MKMMNERYEIATSVGPIKLVWEAKISRLHLGSLVQQINTKDNSLSKIILCNKICLDNIML